jgi:hypothetical protein
MVQISILKSIDTYKSGVKVNKVGQSFAHELILVAATFFF